MQVLYWYCAYLCLHSGVLEHLISCRGKQEEKRSMRNQIVPRAWGGEHFCETVIFVDTLVLMIWIVVGGGLVG